MSGLQRYDDPLDRIRLQRQAQGETFILTEGTPDYIVLSKVIGSRVPVFPLGSRPVVLQMLERGIDEGLGPLVAVVDRDFDEGVDAAVASGLPVLSFDGADLESSLWMSPVLDESLGILGSAQKIAAYGGITAIRTALDAALLPLQRLRAANAYENLGLDFDSLDLRRRISVSDLTLDIGSACDALRSPDTAVSRKVLLSFARSYPIPQCPRTGLLLTRGKDRLAALAVGLRRRLGNLTHAEATAEYVGRVLYSTARAELFDGADWLGELLALL